MPPSRVRVPLPLEKLCVTEIMELIRKEVTICQLIRPFETTSLILRRKDMQADCLKSEVINYLKRLPPLLSKNVRQEITDKLMTLGSTDYKDPYLSSSIQGELTKAQEKQKVIAMAMLEVVLNHEISSIEFANRSYMNGSGSTSTIFSLIPRCSGLKRLVLLNSLFDKDKTKSTAFMTSFLTSLTLGCPLLTELELPDAITDVVQLQIIGRNCHFLQKLDITESNHVTDETILHLCLKPGPDGQLVQVADDELVTDNLTPLCHTLTALNVFFTNVEDKGLCFLLRTIPNLTTFDHSDFTVAALESTYVLLEAKKCQALKLKHARFNSPVNENLKILAICCPDLESLQLDADLEQEIHQSMLLNVPCFTKLTSLTLQIADSNDLAKMLQITPNLLKLEVHCRHLDISVINKFCPKLEELCLREEPSKHMRHLDRNQRCFQALTKLDCQMPVPVEVAAVFFTHARKLRDVDFVRVHGLTDTKFMSWVTENPLTHLESLVLRFVKLTRVSADWLLANCANLTKLGDLGCWNIWSGERSNIKEFCVSQNFDLQVLIDVPMPMTHVDDIFGDESFDDEEGFWDYSLYDAPHVQHRLLYIPN